MVVLAAPVGSSPRAAENDETERQLQLLYLLIKLELFNCLMKYLFVLLCSIITGMSKVARFSNQIKEMIKTT